MGWRIVKTKVEKIQNIEISKVLHFDKDLITESRTFIFWG